jgi:gliding motility-associated-like protein
MAANGTGTWSQSGTSPSVALINNPASASTTISSLTTIGKYTFIWTNPNGCTDSVAITVISSVPPETIIPNIFTPNGDGKNDVFEIARIENFPGSELIIFNRWGNEVYKSANYLNTWDGSDLADGTYFYILNRRESTGSIKVIKGWVYLKR